MQNQKDKQGKGLRERREKERHDDEEEAAEQGRDVEPPVVSYAKLCLVFKALLRAVPRWEDESQMAAQSL